MKKTFLHVALGKFINALAYIWPNLAGNIALDFFINPFAHKLKDFHQNFLSTALRNDFTYNNITIAHYTWGNSPKKVMLIHGWSSSSFRWKKQIAVLLANNYEVHAIDAPAHGNSGGKRLYLPLYKDILKHFLTNIQPVETLIGHSMGGYAIILLQKENPEIPLNKVVIMGAPGNVNDFLNWYKNLLGLSNKAMKLVIEKFLALVGHLPEYYIATDLAKGNTVPALLIHDLQDKATFYKHSQALHKVWTNSQLVLTDGFGHELKDNSIIEKILLFIEDTKA
jgi:pimeloyl-ACP methyl ester carboxylesterase